MKLSTVKSSDKHTGHFPGKHDFPCSSFTHARTHQSCLKPSHQLFFSSVRFFWTSSKHAISLTSG